MKKRNFSRIAAMAAIFALVIIGCQSPDSEDNGITDSVLKILPGTITISPSSGVSTGTQLTANYSGSETVTYQWKKDGAAVSGETGKTYRPPEAGRYTVTVSAAGYESKTSAAVTVTGASLPALTGTVSISGFAAVEETLTADTYSLGGNGDITYQWKRGSTNIGTNNNAYQIQTADVGSTITVTVTRAGYSGSITSAPTAVIIAELPPTPGLYFALIGGAYSVSQGTATAADVVIPTFYEGMPVTMIASNGFSSYTNMRSIRIPGRVTSIGPYAFSNCTSLTAVTIPNSVTSISSDAFTNCSGLTSITIPFFGSGPNGTYPFGYLFGTTSYSNQNSYIPASLKTVIITGGNSIPDNAFYGCANLTSVTIPDSVMSIGESAFSGCTGLTSVIIGNSVTNIGQRAFYDCSSLTSVTIPGKVTSIGQSTFEGCSSLTNVTIPNSVTSLGNAAFANCSGLTSVTIPDNVTSIGQSAFYGCSSLTSATLGNSVRTIGDHAFRNCSGLTSVTIPNSVTSIGTYAFYDCNGLTSITIPFVGAALNQTTNTHFGYIFGNQSFYIPESLKTVIITGGNNIASSAFYDCSGLTIVTIPNSVESIGGNAFSGCSGLTSVTIPNNVTSIGTYAFANCSGLTSVTIPNSVTSIDVGAFYGCNGLTSITIPFVGAALNQTTNTHFAYLFGASSYDNPNYFNIPESLETVIITGGNSVPDNAFYGCANLTSVTIPNTVMSIGNRAFLETGLTSVTIPNSVTSIGDEAFSGCSGLTTVTIGNNVTSIGNMAFANCSGLTNVTIPISVTSIGNRAFLETGLTSVTIPNSVTSIDHGPFASCLNLTAINIDASNSAYTAENGVLYNKNKTLLLQYPAGKTGSSFTIPSSVTSIGINAFNGCSSLTGVTIPNSVTSIDNSAFYNCSSLTSVTIPSSVKSLGLGAFIKTGLTSVTFQGTIASANFSDIVFSLDYLTGVSLDRLRSRFYNGSVDGKPGTYTRESIDNINWTGP